MLRLKNVLQFDIPNVNMATTASVAEARVRFPALPEKKE
jgi:hypothetical protein